MFLGDGTGEYDKVRIVTQLAFVKALRGNPHSVIVKFLTIFFA